MSPGDAAALDTEGIEGGSNVQLAGCKPIVDDPLMQWADATYRAERTAVLRERERRAAGLELAYRYGRLEHTDAWERRWANELVREWGFDPAYVAARTGLSMRRAA